jgi:hypothetical protein
MARDCLGFFKKVKRQKAHRNCRMQIAEWIKVKGEK